MITDDFPLQGKIARDHPAAARGRPSAAYSTGISLLIRLRSMP